MIEQLIEPGTIRITAVLIMIIGMIVKIVIDRIKSRS